MWIILFFIEKQSLSYQGAVLGCACIYFFFFFLISHLSDMLVRRELISFIILSLSEELKISSSFVVFSSLFKNNSNFSLEFSSQYHVVGRGCKLDLSGSFSCSFMLPISRV